MSNHEWEDFGEEVRRTIQKAIENQDYTKLNQTISNTINRAVDSVAKGVKNAANTSQTKYTGYKTYTTDFEKAKRKPQSMSEKQMPAAFGVKKPSKLSSIIGMILGYGAGVYSLFALLVLVLAGSFGIAGWQAAFYIGVAFFGLLTVSGTTAGVLGTKKLAKINRFKTYVKTIVTKEYCNISELAGKVGRDDKKVIDDLEYMIKNRWFAQGHLDRQKTCLMVTDRMYQQYCQLEERKMLERQELENEQILQKENAAKKEAAMSGLNPEVQTVIKKGEVYLQKIRACNDAIPGEEISAKISRIEILVDKIFDRVEQNPKSVADIRKLMEYYLPTTVKLLEAYTQLDVQPVGGENIQTAKREIEATLDTLNIAFEKLLDDLFQDTAWDISSDISVLNTMLAQEGLKEDGLNTKK